jgi:hypothetical protein
VHFADAANHRFVGRRMTFDLEAGVFDLELAQDLEQALLVGLAPACHRQALHRLRELERFEVDVVFVMRIVQYAVELDFIDLGDGAEVARQQRLDLEVLLALQAIDVADLERTLAITDKELRILADRALMNTENADLADEGIADDLEDVRQNVLFRVRVGLEGLRRPAGLAAIERRRIALGRIGCQLARRRAAAGCRRRFSPKRRESESGGPHAAPFRKGRCSSSGLGSRPSSRIARAGPRLPRRSDRSARDALQPPIRNRSRRYRGRATRRLRALFGRQVEQHALTAEALADLADQRRQVDVVGVDLVDDDHPADATSGCQLHHLFAR